MTGTGSAADPYVVSSSGAAFSVTDTNTVDHTLSGAGTNANPYVLSSAVKISPAAGNLITTDANGLLLTCESIQDCVGAGFDDGLFYDDAANQFRARLSTDGGNTVVFGTDGGLFSAGGGGGGVVTTLDTNCINLSGNGTIATPLSADPIINAAAGNLLTCTATGLRAALTVGTCGLTGTGAAASPLAVATGTWPYPCSIDTFGGVVACDASGRLRSEPRGQALYTQGSQTATVAATPVPAAADTTIATRTLNITNPDTCRVSFVMIEFEADVDFVLPAGGSAAMGIASDEMSFHSNRGSTTESDYHVQATKVFNLTGGLAPGAGTTISTDITAGRGGGGATYNRIQHFTRAWQIIV